MHAQQAVHVGGHQVHVGVGAEVLDLPLPALQQPVGRDPRQPAQEVVEGGLGGLGALAVAVDDLRGGVLGVAVAVGREETGRTGGNG